MCKERNKGKTTLPRGCIPEKTQQQYRKERLAELQAGCVSSVKWATLRMFVLSLMRDFKNADARCDVGTYPT